MHFSIPDTQECNGENGSSYTGYNIYINGINHCTVRYKQLHNLNEQLKKNHGSNNVPTFPSKKFLPLSANQVEERRSHLEKYIQIVGQTPELMNCGVFSGFLLAAQLESNEEYNREISIEVYLLNGYSVTINCNINESSTQILEKVCKHMNLPLTYMFYFALFLVSHDNDGEMLIVRKLHDFESPHISQKTIQVNTRVVLRKNYWDPSYDKDLTGDRVTLNLIYLQTVWEVEQGWAICDQDTRSHLASMQARGAKKEYIEFANRLKYYGYTHFKVCECDYPEAETRCKVSVGQRELNLQVSPQDKDKECCFKVTRMRCWRITTHTDTGEDRLELSFEYLMAKDKLQWISICSPQAILISVCLQAIVDELLLQKVGGNIKEPRDMSEYSCFNYMKRDGSIHQVCLSQSPSFDCSPTAANSLVSTPTKSSEPTISMKRLSEKFSSVSLKTKTPLVENDAFEGIGDDDL